MNSKNCIPCEVNIYSREPRSRSHTVPHQGPLGTPAQIRIPWTQGLCPIYASVRRLDLAQGPVLSSLYSKRL